MLRIAISSGHGLHIRGASGDPVPPQLEEVDEARRVVDRIAEMLACPKFHDDKSTSQSANLDAIVAWHNKQSRDLDCSIHFNAYDHTAHGVEVLYVTQQSLAAKVSAAIAKAGGFTDRGAKKRTDLAFLNNTNEPAILIETCFCDNTADSNKYNAKFEEICLAIAESIAGVELPGEPAPPERPERPPPGPEEPPDIADAVRPTLAIGSRGDQVKIVQECLECDVDGMFGPQTEDAVVDFQGVQKLTADGVVGEKTWDALEETYDLPPYEPAEDYLSQDEVVEICALAAGSSVASYNWDDRGQAPIGYIKGMAVAFAYALRRYERGDLACVEMAKADTSDPDADALSWYSGEFEEHGMWNDEDGLHTLRHVYVFLTGLGMRESSGQHCCGRDTSAENTSSDTCEAGLFQTSWNAKAGAPDIMQGLFDRYWEDSTIGYVEVFMEDVSCSSGEWDCYGSGDGYDFQWMCKWQPTFAVETAGVTIRNLRQHYGPINRKEVEIVEVVDDLLRDVQRILTEARA